MNTLKKVLKIAAITLAVILGIFILLIILMMIFPGFKLFGTRFVKKNNTESAPIVYAITQDEEYNIIANTNKFDIEISENKESDELKLTFIDNKWGFTSVATSQLTLKEEGTIIEARMLETQGFVFGDGILKIAIPQTANFHLNLNTIDGDISINHPKLQSIAVNMSDGDFVWKAEEEVLVESSEPDSQSEQSSEDSEEEQETKIVPITSITLDSFTIFTKKANIDLSCFENITANKSFIVHSNKLKLNLKTLVSNTLIVCPNLELNVDNLEDTEELQIYSQKGKIEINSLDCIDKATIISESGDININNHKSPLFASTTSGKVTISKSDSALSVKTTKGEVNIIKGNDNIFVETTSGNINIPEYYKSLNIVTKTGDINIYCKAKDSSVDETNIQQESGDIFAKTEGNEISIKSINGSNIKLHLRYMSKNKDINHKITNIGGTTLAFVMLEKTPFYFRATGNVSGELGNIVNVSPSEEYTLYTPTNQVGTTETNLASINITGGNVTFEGLYE